MKKQFLYLVLLGLLSSVGNVWADLTPALPTSTLTLPTIPSEGWKGTVTPTYYKADNSNVYVFCPYELYLSVANLKWTTGSNGGTSSGSPSAMTPFPASTVFTGYSGAAIKTTEKGPYAYRIKNCNKVYAYLKSGSDKKRTITLAAYVIDNEGNVAGSAAASDTYEANSDGVISIALDYTKEYYVKISQVGSGSAGSSSGNSTFYMIGFEKPIIVTYNANGHGVAPSAQNGLASGAKVTEPSAPSAAGYTFGGWYKEEACTNAWNFSTETVTSDITLYAKWITNYTLTWDFASGSCSGVAGTDYTAGGSVAYGASITYPEDNMMTRDGFDFTGWSTDATTMPDEDLTITAQWATAAAKYDITFSKGVYTAYDGAASFPEGENASNVTLEELSSDNNYRFDGWIADVDVKETTLSGTTISAGTLIDAGTKVFVTQNTTFTAQWTEKHAVTFNSNGGSAVTTQYVVDGETADEPTAPTRTNYTFTGWQLSGSDYDFSTEVSDDIALDATWSRNTIIAEVEDITLVSTSATIGSTSPLTGVYYGNDDKFTYTGNAKIGTGGAMFGTPSSKKWVGFTIPSGYSATVTANSTNSNTRHCVLVTESDREGAAGDATFLLDITTDSETTTKTSSSIGAGSYALGSTSGSIDINSVVVHVTYPILTVTLKVTGQADQVINVTSGETLGNIFLSGELPTPSVAGYTFNGWKQANNEPVTKETVISGSMDIYADLTGDTYNITLDKGTNGSTDGAATVTMGETELVIVTAAEGASGYALMGYYTATDNDVKVAETDGALVASIDGWTDSDGKWVKTSDATLYAQWEAIAAPTAMTITGAGSYAKNAEATLTVTEVDGSPIPTIAWYSSNADGSELSDDPVETGTTYSPSTATAGKFYFVAKATNSQGTFTSDVQTITVKPAAPTITKGDFNFDNEGYAVTLTNNEATGDLKIKIGSADWANYAAAIYATTTTSYQAKVVVNGAESDVVSLGVTNTFDGEKKYIAWVYESNYENAPKDYNVANDEIYKSLKTIYNVVLVDIKDYKSSITDEQKTALNGNLDDADLVVISEAAAGGSKAVIGLKDIVGNVPMLNMKFYAYTKDNDESKNRWGWGTPANAAKTKRAITPISKTYKLWDGVEFVGDSIKLFSGSNSQNHIQTVTLISNTPDADNANMAYAYGTSAVAMHTSASKKFFGFGLSCDDYKKYNNNVITIVKNAAAMLIAGEALDSEVTSVSGTISVCGWSTFSSSYPLNLGSLSGADAAYVVSSITDSKAVLSPATGKVPSGTGLMIKGDAGEEFTINTTSETTTAPATNFLVGVPGGTTVTAANNESEWNYVFGWETGEEENPGFYLINSTSATLTAGKAYLHTTAVLGDNNALAPSVIRFVEEESNATNLGNIEATDEAVKFIQDGQLFIKKNGVIYDAMGRIIR